MPDLLTATIGATALAGYYLFQDEIRAIKQSVANYLVDNLYYTVIIDKITAPLLSFALKQLVIKKYLIQRNISHVRDSNNNGFLFEPVNDKIYYCSHKLYFHSFGVCFSEDQIVVSKFWGTKQELEKFFTETCQEYCSPTNTIIIRNSWQGKWMPSIREKRQIKLDKNIKKVVESCQSEFIDRRNWYKENGYSYHWGALLVGPTGTHKSDCLEYLAEKFNKTIHVLTINSQNMSDDDVIHLFNNLPPNALLVIEEIDRQFKTKEGSIGNNVTDYGILTGIDAPPRLPDGCLVIMTTNDHDFYKKQEWKELFRPGRIDKVFTFVNKDKDE